MAKKWGGFAPLNQSMLEKWGAFETSLKGDQPDSFAAEPLRIELESSRPDIDSDDADADLSDINPDADPN